MNVEECVHGLQLNDHLSTNQKVQAIGVLDEEILIGHRTELLLLKLKPAKRQLMSKRSLVGGLEKPRPKFAMNLHGGTKDPVGQFFLNHGFYGGLCSVFSVSELRVLRGETQSTGTRRDQSWAES